ncbi:mCG1050949 [Mus musculus]|nr:mCG1050949 [Mus musculus]
MWEIQNFSAIQKTAGLCIPHPHPCSLPSAESRNQGGSRWSLRQKPLGPGGPLCSHQEGGRLSGAEDGAASEQENLFMVLVKLTVLLPCIFIYIFP